MKKRLDEAIQFFDTGETKSFNEIYSGKENLFEDMDDVISPKMKGLFESTYGGSQGTHLKEEQNGQPANTEPEKGDEKMVLNEELKRIYEEAQLKEALDFDDDFGRGDDLDPESYFDKIDSEDENYDDFDFDAVSDTKDKDDDFVSEDYDSLDDLIDKEADFVFEDFDDGTRLEHQYESKKGKGGNLREDNHPEIKINKEGFYYIDFPLRDDKPTEDVLL